MMYTDKELKAMREEGMLTVVMRNAMNELEDEFTSLIDINAFNAKLAKLKKARGRSDWSSVLAGLYEMFRSCGISFETGRDWDYYAELVKKSDIPRFIDIEDKIMYALYKRFGDYPSPEEYMKRIVDKLSNSEDNWQNDTLRLRILKQFIKYGGTLTFKRQNAATGKNEEVKVYNGKPYIVKYVKKITGKAPKLNDILENISDDIFSCLDSATKDQKKSDGTYGILKMADDLAAGKFRSGGATKRSLYYFAMVYGMTYFSGASGEKRDPATDIEKNLFQDYYTNNLVRFITNAYSGKLNEFEYDPSGQGINYKNFAEMVYIYYISRNISGEEKIKRSYEMIERLKNSASKPVESSSMDTVMYRENFFTDTHILDHNGANVLEYSEEDFENFIRRSYNCDPTDETGAAIGALQVENDQNSAFAAYREIISMLEYETADADSCNYGLWFTDISSYQKDGYGSFLKKHPDADKERFSQLIGLLSGINAYLGYSVDENVNFKDNRSDTKKFRLRALNITKPSEMTRTSIVVAYYYFYNALHESDDPENRKSFSGLFNDFKDGIDVYLEQAGYQEFSGRNIFDVITAFSAYAYPYL